MQIGRDLITEQSTSSVPDYRGRVYRLAALYTGIFLASVVAILVIVWHGKFFVTLSQRSNVETLTLAFILALFGYMAVISLPGLVGALRIVAFNLPAWLGRGTEAVEARKQRALKPKKGPPATAYLNCRVQTQGGPVHISIRDGAGSLGQIVIDGVKMTHREAVQDGSNSVFAYYARRIEQIVQQREPEREIDIVQWTVIDDEPAKQYGSLVAFSERLSERLGEDHLWPTVELSPDEVEMLSREGTELCPILRNEAQLPDMEYKAEHRLPIIPEPLAFVALSRDENRADPVASMGCAFLVTIVILGILLLIVFMPPWVPPR